MKRYLFAALMVASLANGAYGAASARLETVVMDTQQSSSLTVNHKAYSAIQFSGTVTDSVAQAAVNITGKTGTLGFKTSYSSTTFFSEVAITIVDGAAGTWTATLPAAQWVTNNLVKTRFYGDLRLSDFGNTLPSIDLWLSPSSNHGTETNYVSPTSAAFETNLVEISGLNRISFDSGFDFVYSGGTTSRLRIAVDTSLTNGLASTNLVDLYYYPRSNPSNWVTEVVTNGLYPRNNPSNWVTEVVTNGLWNYESGTNWVDLYYYPRSNPSNWVTEVVTNGLYPRNNPSNWISEADSDLLYLLLNGGNSPTATILWGGQNLTNVGSLYLTNDIVMTVRGGVLDLSSDRGEYITSDADFELNFYSAGTERMLLNKSLFGSRTGPAFDLTQGPLDPGHTSYLDQDTGHTYGIDGGESNHVYGIAGGILVYDVSTNSFTITNTPLVMSGGDIHQGPSNTIYNTGNLSGTNGAFWVVGSQTNWLLFP